MLVKLPYHTGLSARWIGEITQLSVQQGHEEWTVSNGNAILCRKFNSQEEAEQWADSVAELVNQACRHELSEQSLWDETLLDGLEKE